MFQKRILGMLLALTCILCCSVSALAAADQPQGDTNGNGATGGLHDNDGLPSFGPPPESERPEIVYCDPFLLSGNQYIGSFEIPYGCWIGQEEPDITKLPINKNRMMLNKNHNDSTYFETRFLWDTNRGGWVDTESKSLTIFYPSGNMARLSVPYSFYKEDPFVLRYVGHSEPTTTPGAKLVAGHNAKWYSSFGSWAYATAPYTVVRVYPNGMTFTDEALSLSVVEHNNNMALSYMPTLPTKDAVDFEDVQLVIEKKDRTVEMVPFKNNVDEIE